MTKHTNKSNYAPSRTELLHLHACRTAMADNQTELAQLYSRDMLHPSARLQTEPLMHRQCGNVSTIGAWFISYETPVAKVHLLRPTVPVLVIDNSRFSATTSKQLSTLHTAWVNSYHSMPRLRGLSLPQVMHLPDIQHLTAEVNLAHLVTQADMWLTSAQTARRLLKHRIAALGQFDLTMDRLEMLCDMREAMVGGSGMAYAQPALQKSLHTLFSISGNIKRAAPLPANDESTRKALDSITTLRGIAALEI